MCVVIFINRGEKEIATPREFKEHFGFEIPTEDYFDEINIDLCLCQVNIEQAFKDHNIEFKTYWGDYYVGQLDQVKGD